MSHLSQSLRAPWHMLRIIYLVIGAMLMAQAVQAGDAPFGLVGSIFLFQSIFNTGCCGVARSSTDPVSAQHSLEETDYIEIK